MAQRVGDRRVGAHRVPAEHEAPLADGARHHRFQVADQLRVSITLARRGGVGLAVAARVVGDDGWPARSSAREPCTT